MPKRHMRSSCERPEARNEDAVNHPIVEAARTGPCLEPDISWARMWTERLTSSRHGRTALVVLGDGARRNALRTVDWSSLRELIERLSASPDVQAVVLSGCDGNFSAGSDLNEWVDADPDDVAQTFREIEACCQALEAAPVPVIAAVEGVAVGAGCQLALASDILVMADGARIGMPIARLGIGASTAFVARVSRRAGSAVAADMYLTERLFSAADATMAGLTTRVISAGTALVSAMAIAEEAASVSRPVLTAAKRALAITQETCSASGSSAVAPAVPSPLDHAKFREAVRRALPTRRST